MEKMNMHTPDLAKENYEKLAALFPNAVTETKDENGETVRAIDADVLRSEIAATVVEGTQERYQFTWPDKRKSVVLANQPIAKTLRLDRENPVGRDGTPAASTLRTSTSRATTWTPPSSCRRPTSVRSK